MKCERCGGEDGERRLVRWSIHLRVRRCRTRAGQAVLCQVCLLAEWRSVAVETRLLRCAERRRLQEVERVQARRLALERRGQMRLPEVAMEEARP